jgi:hypothetical protein
LESIEDSLAAGRALHMLPLRIGAILAEDKRPSCFFLSTQQREHLYFDF